MSDIRNVITINDFNYSQGGASKVAIDTANLIAKNGLNSIFVSAVSDDEKCSLDSAVVQYRYCGNEFLKYKNKLNGMLNGIHCKGFTIFLHNILKRYDPKDTIVHVHGWTKACSSAFFPILKKSGFKTVLTLHEYFSFCPNGAYFDYKKYKACCKNACSLKCLICNCDSRNYFFKAYRYVRELKYKKDIDFQSVYAIYISMFEKKIIDRQISIPHFSVIENPITPLKKTAYDKIYDFAFIGRTSKEKGIDLFIRLAEQLQDKKFLIVGNFKTELKNVHVTGWVSEAMVDEYLLKSKTLVFPSIWPETFGLNVIRALAAGIPCLVSSNTAAEGYVVSGKNGYVFQQGNLHDLKEKALKAYQELDNNYKTDYYYFEYVDYYRALWECYDKAFI